MSLNITEISQIILLIVYIFFKIQTYEIGRLSKKSRTSRYYEETLDQEESISDLLDKLIFTPDLKQMKHMRLERH